MLRFAGLYLLAAFFVISGCAVKYQLPENYENPASISDTYSGKKKNSAHFFVALKINEKSAHHAASASYSASTNQGRLIAVGSRKLVAAELLNVTIGAGIGYNADISALFSNEHDSFLGAEGVVELDAQPGQDYIVKGQLNSDYSAVWIENINGVPVTNLVESKSDDLEKAEIQKAEVLALIKQKQGDSREKRFSNIAYGETIALVENRLGKPEKINEDKGFNFWKAANYHYVEYIYEELGAVNFETRFGLAFVTSVSKHYSWIKKDKLQISDYERDMLTKEATHNLSQAKTSLDMGMGSEAFTYVTVALDASTKLDDETLHSEILDTKHEIANRFGNPEDLVQVYLDKADLAYKEDRLDSPKENCAQYYYSKVVEIDPENERGLKGKKKVLSKLSTKFYKSIRSKDIEAAEEYLARYSRLAGGDRQINTMRNYLDAAK